MKLHITQLEITRLSPYDDKQELLVLESCTVLFIDDFNLAAVGNFKRDMLQSLIDLHQKRNLVTCYTPTITKQEFTHPQKQSDKSLYELIFLTISILYYNIEINKLI